MGIQQGSTTHRPQGPALRACAERVKIGIILPLILISLIGVIEITSVFVHYVSVVNASRDGARSAPRASPTQRSAASRQNDLARLPNAITPTADIKIDHTPVGTAIPRRR